MSYLCIAIQINLDYELRLSITKTFVLRSPCTIVQMGHNG